jgi:hypothetical protein
MRREKDREVEILYGDRNENSGTEESEEKRER